MSKLTYKQQRFVDLYDGNGTETARRAGYKGNNNSLAVIASRLLKNPKILSAIQNRDTPTGTLNRRQIQELWTAIIQNESVSTRDRLKASDSLAKSMGMFKKHVKMEDITQLSDKQLEQKLVEHLSILGIEYSPQSIPINTDDK